jgi:hypothetical protein
LEKQYFDRFANPHLSPQIEYLGEVTHEESVKLLQDARAKLFPIEWDEPLGLVMIELVACGTPSSQRTLGAVPDVIEYAVNGVIVDTWPWTSSRRTKSLLSFGFPSFGWRSRSRRLRTGSRSSCRSPPFVIAAGYLVWKGSSESGDSDERVEAQLDALLKQAGIEPTEVHRKLPAKFQPQVGAKE